MTGTIDRHSGWPPFPAPTDDEYTERAALIAAYRSFTLKFTPVYLITNHRCYCSWRGGDAEADSWCELFALIRSRVGKSVRKPPPNSASGG